MGWFSRRPDNLDRAIAAQEGMLWKTLPQLASYADERHENQRRSMVRAPRVGEVVSVSVSNTADTKCTCLGLEFVDGTRATLWLDSNILGVGVVFGPTAKVRTITPY